MDISIIGMPIMYGCDRKGVEFGPAKLRESGMLEVIKKHKGNAYDLGNVNVENVPEWGKYDSHKKIKYFKPILDANTNLAHAVYSALSAKSFPFIIGGDHSLGLGSMSGASRYYENLAVIWVDAHGDINTQETSPSGNFHGMPLAAAMGLGEEEAVNLYYEGIKVKAENVYILGARDLDEGEVKLAKDLKLNLYTMENVRKNGLNSCIEEIIEEIKSSNVDGVHLSFDIDVLDKTIVPGTGTPVKDGFNLDEGKSILKEFLSIGLINSMDFVELNPYLDQDNIAAKNCIELIDWIFEVIK